MAWKQVGEGRKMSLGALEGGLAVLCNSRITFWFMIHRRQISPHLIHILSQLERSLPALKLSLNEFTGSSICSKKGIEMVKWEYICLSSKYVISMEGEFKVL